ncbi:MAG: hypothetical protein HY775_07135 [Acidobacteria bacterium]|nr:hypothetical protein [Acidobacteriota bacterium]
MSTAEHSLSFLLRNSGVVLEEVEHRDVVLQRRDGEDLYLALRSRERGVRESLNVLARVLRAALHDEAARSAIARWLVDELPWTNFLPDADRQEFLSDFARTATACVEVDNYEPLIQSLRGWKATAEIYADPRVAAHLRRPHRGPSAPLKRPGSSRDRAS